MTSLAIKLALTCIGLGLLMVFVLKIRQAGRDAERAVSAETTIKDIGVRNEIEADAAGRTAAERKRLLDQWTGG